MTKVAALYIATGRYTVFWPEFYESAEKYLLKDCVVHYFVFTDGCCTTSRCSPFSARGKSISLVTGCMNSALALKKKM